MKGITPIERSLATRCACLSDVMENAPRTTALAPGILEALEVALLGGETHYTVRPGMPELRRQIAEKVSRIGGPRYDSIDQVLITTGEAESLFVALLELASQPGSALIAGKGHTALFQFMGLKPIVVSDGIVPDDTRLLYRELESDPSTHEFLVHHARKKKLPDILNLGNSLEQGVRFPPFTEERTIVIGDIRSPFPVGYLVGPEEYLGRMRIWKQAASICSAAPSQRAALAILAEQSEEGSE